MGVSKVEFGGDTLIDLTEDSVTPETMMKGTTAHNSAGEPIEGTFDPDIYQTKTDDSLKTKDKSVVGAINEVNTIVKGDTAGVWRFNDTLIIPEVLWGQSYYFPFSVTTPDMGEQLFNEWYFWSDGRGIKFIGEEVEVDSYAIIESTPETSWHGWFSAYQNVQFLAEVRDSNFNEWRDENADKIQSPKLETISQNAIDAINEISNKIQKTLISSISNVDTWAWGAFDISCENGISWSEGFALQDENYNSLASGHITQRIPVVAGDNVTFTVDEENQVVKINATGGGSGGGSGGTTIKYSEGLEYSDEDAGFVVEGIGDCTDIDVMIPPEHSGRPVFCINAEAFEADGTMRSLYIPKTVTEIRGSIFSTDSFARIHIYCEAKSQPDGWSEDWNMYLLDTTYIEWGYVLGGGAGGSNSGGSLQMPQIRFANFQKVELWDEETETLSTRYRFTVENLGGGTLQVGDKLQICCRRKYPNGKKKLRRMADIEITENDLNQRFLKIEVDPEDESVEKWLFRNDRNQSSVTTLSAMYFRLKRVTKYSDSDGKECNAIFSNVEQVWKTYILPCNGGWELNIK